MWRQLLFIALLQVSGATEITEDECINHHAVRRSTNDVHGLRITKFGEPTHEKKATRERRAVVIDDERPNPIEP